MSRSLVASASLSRKPSCDRSATTLRYRTLKPFARPCPTSSSKLSRRATSTTLIPDAAICRANSLPIPDEAPVTSAHGPNLLLSSAAVIFLLRSACLVLVVFAVSVSQLTSQQVDPFVNPGSCDVVGRSSNERWVSSINFVNAAGLRPQDSAFVGLSNFPSFDRNHAGKERTKFSFGFF